MLGYLTTATVLLLISSVVSFVLSPDDEKCAKENNFPNFKFEDYYEYSECPETSPPEFNKYLLCSLKKGKVLTEEGTFNDHDLKNSEDPHAKTILRLFRRVPVTKNKEEYAAQINKIPLGFFHQVPPFCKDGYTNQAWSKCGKANGIENFTKNGLKTFLHDKSRHSPAFKKYLLCGLKTENILTANGEIDDDVMSALVFAIGEPTKLQLKGIPIGGDKEEYAYKIFSIISQKL